MKSSTCLLGIVLTVPINAHYVFGRLILDGKWTNTWEYIREISGDPTIQNDPDFALVAPLREPKSKDIICGRNASVAFNHPKIATIKAGDRIGFGTSASVVDPPSMYHPGFASAWLSKAPSEDGLDMYSGQNDWFKIMQVTGRTNQSIAFEDPLYKKYWDFYKSDWGTFRAESWNFTIPVTTPPGHYLLRFEHIFPNREDAQIYPNCAHIKIIGSGVPIGTPGPLVSIPGVYQRGQPDMYFAYYDYGFNVSTFVPPAPPIWSG